MPPFVFCGEKERVLKTKRKRKNRKANGKKKALEPSSRFSPAPRFDFLSLYGNHFIDSIFEYILSKERITTM